MIRHQNHDHVSGFDRVRYRFHPKSIRLRLRLALAAIVQPDHNAQARVTQIERMCPSL